MSGEESKKYILFRASDVFEYLHLSAQFLRVGFIDGKGTLGKLDLDQIDAAICSINEQVDLSTLWKSFARAMHPAAVLRFDLGDAKFGFDVLDMF